MTQLDDPQLRAKLIKASNDMPHVDLWARLQSEAAQISEEAQERQHRPRFTIFSGLRLFAPAFVALLVMIVTLPPFISREHQLSEPRYTFNDAITNHVDTLTPPSEVVPDDSAVEAAYQRRLTAVENRLAVTNRLLGAGDSITSHPLRHDPRDDLRREMINSRRQVAEQAADAVAPPVSNPRLRLEFIPRNPMLQ